MTNFVKYLGRFLGGLITAPIIVLVYLLATALLVGAGAENNGMAWQNLMPIIFAWVVVFTTFPLLEKALARI